MPFTILFVGTLFHFAVAANTNIQAHICRLPTTPVVTQPADGTHTDSPSVTVAGTASPNNTITILDNGVTAATTTSDETGLYQVDTPLVENDNQLVVRAANDCSQTADAAPITVVYDKPPIPPPPPPGPDEGGGSSTSPGTSSSSGGGRVPIGGSSITGVPILRPEAGLPVQTSIAGQLVLRVYAPRSQTTTRPSMVLVGETNLSAKITITVNGRIVGEVQTDANGHFSMRLPFTMGVNKLVITATHGKDVATIYLDVTRTPAPPHKSFWQQHQKTFIIGIVIGVIMVAVIGYAIGLKIRETRNDK